MRPVRLLLLMLILSQALPISYAYSIQGVNSLLVSYAVPNASIRSFSAVGLNYSAKQYVALYNTSGGLNFLVNTSIVPYTIVLNATNIYNVIRNYTINASYSEVNFTGLYAQMHKYQNSSVGTLNSCLQVTGLASGATCTQANYCQSCQFVPICVQVYNAAAQNSSNISGWSSFSQGIATFANQYSELNSSFNNFYKATNQANKGGAAASIATLGSAFTNISNITQIVQSNPIFPAQNVTVSQIANCANYGANITAAPWYCSAFGLCQPLTYNYTKLALINNLVSGLTSLPLTNSQINRIATNASNVASVYIYPVLSKQRHAQLLKIFNTTIPSYSILVNNSVMLLSHLNNFTLKTRLNLLLKSYTNASTNYFTINLTTTNTLLAAQYANLSSSYASLNATYASTTTLAANNTAKVIELQLSNTYSPSLASLAFSEISLNNVVTSGNITNISSTNAQLRSVSRKLATYSASPISLTEFARAVDSAPVRIMGSALGLGFSKGTSLAPAFGAFASLVIGLIVLSGLYYYRATLLKKSKLVLNKNTTKNWKMLFVIFAGVVILFVLITYSILSGANGSAPYGAFKAALSSSKSVVVAINGTPSSGQTACATKVAAQLISINKNPIQIAFANGICKTSNSTNTVDGCLGTYAANNIPVIVLTNGTRNSVSLYSLYGTVLSFSGNSTTLGNCYASFFLTG